ncbi:MAG: hypothetical protein H7Z43_05180 [Clostridia bacterium]|nr:hypothetical protein [Deltaproteobacteria bacterium]
MRSVSLVFALLAACGSNKTTNELPSGTITAVQNLSTTNVLGFDGAVDLTGGRDTLVIAGVQVGEANYGNGTIGQTDGTSLLVVGRYDTQLQPLWLASFEGGVGSSTPFVATQTLGTAGVALSDFDGTVSLGGGALAAPVVAAFSDADGSVRWSASAADGTVSHAAALVIDSTGDFVLAHNTDETPSRVKLVRFTAASGAVILSRTIGLGTGNQHLTGMTYDLDNNLIVLVRFDGTITLNQSYTAPEGMFYGYVAKIGRDSGTALWSRPLRVRTQSERVAVGVLSNSDVTLVGPFGFADDRSENTNPESAVRYLRTAVLGNTSGATMWTRRDDMINAASLDVVDVSDFTDNINVIANFNGTLKLDAFTATTTTASAMAVTHIASADGTPLWLNYTKTSAARGTRVGQLSGGNILGLGTFTALGASTSSVFAIQIVE